LAETSGKLLRNHVFFREFPLGLLHRVGIPLAARVAGR
jgi:hypothetical protein